MTTQYVSYSARGNSGGGGGGGTVTSVGLSLPSIFTVTGSPVTTSGTLTGTFTTQNANTVFAGPSSGAPATPTFRALVVADIPSLSYVSSVSGTAPISSSGGLTPTISISQATTSTNGYLSSTDWNTFNGKQAAGNYITALTGDVTATGPGSVAATLATVNTNTGSFGSSTAIPSFTVNGKGLITAASTNAVVAPAGTLSGTTLNSTVVSSSLTSVGTIATGTWAGTTIAVAHGGTGLTTLTSGNVILGAGTSTPTFVAPGTSGNVLTSNGSTWVSSAVSSGTLQSKSSNYTLLSTDSGVLVTTGSSNVTITLPTAVGATGKQYLIKKVDNGTGSVPLATTSSQTIEGNSSSSLSLALQYESVTLVSDGSNWQIVDHRCDTSWVSYTPTFVGFGSSQTNVECYWRRVGDSLEMRGRFQMGSSFSGQPSISFPPNCTASSSGIGGAEAIVGMTATSQTNQVQSILVANGATSILFGPEAWGGGGSAPITPLTTNSFDAPNDYFTYFVTGISISGWFA